MAYKKRVLITGAAGHIGSFLTPRLIDRYDLVLTDKNQPTGGTASSIIQAEMADFGAVQRLCQGIEVVVHLAADPRREAPWESLLPNNIIATYNVFEAAAQAQCKRVIFASSINAVDGYPPDVQIQADMPVRPPNLYGATKVWGEALARYYADQRGLSVICLRFGAVLTRERVMALREHPYPESHFTGKIITLDDAADLILNSIEAPEHVQFGIFPGLSDNYWKRLDLSTSREVLGYAPKDDAFSLTGNEHERQ